MHTGNSTFEPSNLRTLNSHAGGTMNADQIGLQMYTLRSHTAQDMAGTLRQVAAMGYPAVELAGYGGLSVAEIGAVLAETGLRAMGAHVGYAQFDTRAAEVIAE